MNKPNPPAGGKDHRQIGVEQDLFSFHEIAPGAIFWHPKGWTIYKALENFIRDRILEEGYMEISTPVMVKSDLFKESGHWDFYKENMFNLTVENQSYSLKPMNCPESAVVYKTKIRSYNDLPLRFSEFGILHRNELSGVLGGAFRVRQFVIDDAHIYVRPDQIQDEIHSLLNLTMDVYESLNFKPHFYLSTRPDKAMGDKKDWEKAEKDLEEALKKAKVKYDIKEKDGAFYGPKIDIHIKDSQNRDWQLATIQLDFQIPLKMKVMYIDSDGKEKTPVIVHRGIFGSLERFIAILTEHFQGAFPLWLSPVQVIIIPITDKQISHSKKILNELRENGIRAEIDDRAETMQARVRDAALQKVPYLVIIGDKEIEGSILSVRNRSGKVEKFTLSVFLQNLKKDRIPSFTEPTSG